MIQKKTASGDSPNKVWMLLLLALLAAFPPLSIDMYLPAIPLLQKVWGQPLEIVNLTLVGFFATFGLFLLVYGPLSDRFGRRRPLLAGIAIYIAASILCAYADGIVWLIVARLFQAVGAASASAMTMAISKDIYSGQERERALAYIGVIMAVAPMVAPTLGGWIMVLVSWRWVFVLQACIGVFSWVCVQAMPETLKAPTATRVSHIGMAYLQLLGNRKFIGLVFLMTLIGIPHFAFIGGSADIYITGFGISERDFGYFFALNAASIMAGSLAFTRLQSRIGSNGLLIWGFAGIMIGGGAMFMQWLPGPWRLALPMSVASFSFGLSRPPSNSLILEQVDRHAGTASSLMVFCYFMLGSLAMWMISLDWADKVSTIGAFGAGVGATVLGVWLLLPRTFFLGGGEPCPGRIDKN